MSRGQRMACLSGVARRLARMRNALDSALASAESAWREVEQAHRNASRVRADLEGRNLHWTHLAQSLGWELRQASAPSEREARVRELLIQLEDETPAASRRAPDWSPGAANGVEEPAPDLDSGCGP